MTTARVLLFMLDEQTYALDISAVERIVRVVEITPLPQAPTNVRGVINVRGEILPVLDMCQFLHLPVNESNKRLEQSYAELSNAQKHLLHQERLKALGQMASGIVHDIYNTLSPILGYSELLLKNESLSDTAREYIKTIKDSGEDIAASVGRLKAFYRTRTDEDNLLPIQMNEVVAKAVALTKPRWSDMQNRLGKTISVQTECQENLPLALGLESEIREALTNLIFNAVDAIAGNGTITVRTKSEDNKVVLEVSDNGKGMDEETRRHCLEPFFTTKGQDGTGLGLAMVYGTMQRHKGSVDIISKLGEGTTIRLNFPVSSIQELPPPETEDIAPFPTPLRILCIDDEQAVLDLTRKMLENDQHIVQLALGGQAGIEAFESALRLNIIPDVVVTDFGMPHIDGCVVLEIIKGLSPKTPVVLLTAWGGILAKGEMPCVADYIMQKPASLARLRRALHKVMGLTPVKYAPAVVSCEKPRSEFAKPIMSSIRILIMDDEPCLRDVAQRLLASMGYNSDTTASGEGALEKYRAAMDSGKKYDLVLLDINIKNGMGAEEAIKHLLEMDPQVTAVLASGSVDHPMCSHSQEYGFKGVLTKPYDMESLDKTLKKIFGLG